MLRKDENSDSICRLVHPVCAVLAAGVAGAGFVSGGLVVVSAAAPCRHLSEGRFRSRSHDSVSAGENTRMAQASTRQGHFLVATSTEAWRGKFP